VNGFDHMEDRRKHGGSYTGGERRGHDMCPMVVEHHAALAQMGADISHIKAKIDNGLTEKMEALSKRLDALSQDSWATHLLSGGMKKLIGLIIFLILANALANNAIWAVIKANGPRIPSIQSELPDAAGKISDRAP